MMDAVQLESCLVAAFPTDRRFTPNEIAERHETFQSYEGNSVARFFAGKAWTEIGFYELVRDYQGPETACLFFMRPAAAAHFVATYLRIAVREREDGHDTRCMLLNLLSPGILEGGDTVWFDRIRELLSEHQRAAVRDCIEYIRLHFGAEILGVDFDVALANV